MADPIILAWTSSPNIHWIVPLIGKFQTLLHLLPSSHPLHTSNPPTTDTTLPHRSSNLPRRILPHLQRSLHLHPTHLPLLRGLPFCSQRIRSFPPRGSSSFVRQTDVSQAWHWRRREFAGRVDVCLLGVDVCTLFYGTGVEEEE